MNATQQFLQEASSEVITEMVEDFQARKRIAEAAKYKEPTDFNIQDNPNLRAHLPYPRLMYHWGQRINQQVRNQQEHEQLLASGWKEGPPPPMTDPDYVAANPGDPSGTEERFEALEREMADMKLALGQILDRLTEPKQTKQPKA